MQKTLILYGTVGCHLCEDAEHLLQSLTLHYVYIDIIEDNALLEKFATSIPVLHATDAKTDLRWPFNQQQISDWLNS